MPKSPSETANRTPKQGPAAKRHRADERQPRPIEPRGQNQEPVRAKSDLERSRARYFELFDFAPVATFTFTHRGLIDSLNLAAAELLELDRPQALGMHGSSFFADESRDLFRQHVEKVFETPGKHANDLVLAANRGGARRHIHLVSRMIRGEFADQPLCLSAAIDITSRQAAESEVTRLNTVLEQRTRELEESNKDLESFIYSISHDLRAPLRNMAGFATIISEDFGSQVPPEVDGFAKRILASNEKMLHLVDDLLRLSRLGRKPLEVSRTDLNELLDEVIGDLSSEVAGREIEWQRQPLPVAECDRGLMRQVFVNLLTNALKYSRPRRPAVIKIGSDVRSGERVVYIQDNGVGFDMRYYEKLFGVFQRLHLASEFEGNGVGLAMVSRILARHGGRAFAEGRVGQGATFWFTFEGLKNAV